MKDLKPLSYRWLLSETNAKTSKGESLGYLTGVLYLAPHTIATQHEKRRVNVCPLAKLAGCDKACLYTAGHGAMSNVEAGRINRTLWFIHRREEFMRTLIRSIELLKKRAKKAGLTPLVRLNGTSDIMWENIPVTRNGETFANIFEAFPALQFYDYTKLVKRIERPLSANYDLTFSYSGTPQYAPHVARAVAAGARIAVVFRHKESIPATFHGMPVINGDDTDVRHIEPRACIVALYAKGKAKADQSAFIVNN